MSAASKIFLGAENPCEFRTVLKGLCWNEGKILIVAVAWLYRGSESSLALK